MLQVLPQEHSMHKSKCVTAFQMGCVCKENNKLTEKYMHGAKLQFDCVKLQVYPGQGVGSQGLSKGSFTGGRVHFPCPGLPRYVRLGLPRLSS